MLLITTATNTLTKQALFRKSQLTHATVVQKSARWYHPKRIGGGGGQLCHNGQSSRLGQYSPLQQQQQQQQKQQQTQNPWKSARLFSEESNSKKSRSSPLLWQVGTATAVVLTYVGVRAFIDYSSRDDTLSDGDDETDGPVQPQAEITSRVYFDVTIDNIAAGRIVMGLHGSIVPKTVQNFETLCQGDRYHPRGRRLAYEGSIFHRIIPNFMIQGGDYTNFNGTGGLSIYGDKFADENFQLKHLGPGILSMANAGRDTNGSQFFITTKRTPHLDGRHVVFGVVQEGWDVVKRIERCGSNSGSPNKRVTIVKAGVLTDNDNDKKTTPTEET